TNDFNTHSQLKKDTLFERDTHSQLDRRKNEMETNLQNVKASQSNSPLKARFELYESILEIIFAILGGFFIFLGWLLGKFEMETASVAFFLTAYVVGGFFKAKEGITETIAEKSLNVEILMILAA